MRTIFKSKIKGNPFTKDHVYDKRIYKSMTCVKCKSSIEYIEPIKINKNLVEIKCTVCNERMLFKNWSDTNV